MSREYREKSIDDAISRVLKISRREAIKKVTKMKNERPVFVLTYNPALPLSQPHCTETLEAREE